MYLSLLAPEINIGGGTGGGAYGTRLRQPLDELGTHGRVPEEELQEGPDPRHLEGTSGTYRQEERGGLI